MKNTEHNSARDRDNSTRAGIKKERNNKGELVVDNGGTRGSEGKERRNGR